MPLIIRPGYTIFFAHVPKTGGSSVENYLVSRFGEMLLSGKGYIDTKSQRVMLSPPQHLAAADLRDFLPDKIDFSFALVRDPLRRLISEFQFQSGHSRTSHLSFSTWLRIVLRAARIEPRLYDNHIRPQVDLIPAGGKTFRLEDGFDTLITHLDRVTGENRPDLKVGHLLKSKTKASIRYSRQDIRLVSEFYAADYARLGYAPPESTELPDDPFAALRSLIAIPIAHALVMRQRLGWLR